MKMKNKPIYYLNISRIDKNSSVTKGLEDLKYDLTKIKYSYFYPCSSELKNKIKNQDIHYIQLLSKNLYNFKNIQYLINKIKHKINIIQITTTKSLEKSTQFINYASYQSFYFLYILFIIISIQKINGTFILNLPIIASKNYFEFLYILNIIYKKVTISKSLKKKTNEIEIKIKASYYNGVSKTFYQKINTLCKQYSYFEKYNTNNTIFIHSFLSNNIPESFIKTLQKYIHSQYQTIIQNTKDKIIILKNINNKYIIQRILNQQINESIKYIIKFNKIFQNITSN
jgi:hypothetical protein